MRKVTIYTLKNCDTCRRAVKWLKARGTTFEERPIRETPPTVGELRTMLNAMQGERRRLFNVSGHDYRDLGIAGKLSSMSDSDVLDLLANNGNLVKRPFLFGSDVAVVGFNEAEWTTAFAG